MADTVAERSSGENRGSTEAPTETAEAGPARAQATGGPLPAGAPDSVDAPAGARGWEAILSAEEERLRDRRKWLLETRSFTGQLPPAPVALALSGGGIRSATFSLGVLRALSRRGILTKIDYLSTVSGGGYAGSFYCSLFVPEQLRGVAPATDAPEIGSWARARADALRQGEATPGDVLGGAVGKRALSQLREGGHFLNPNGTSDALFAAVIAVRNWIAVALVCGLAVLTFFLAVQIPRTWGEPFLNIAQVAQPKGVEPPGKPIIPTTARVQAGAPVPSILCTADVRPQNAGAEAKCSISPRPAQPEQKQQKPDVGPVIGASWLWVIALLLIPFWIVPSAWAYWFTQTGSDIARSRSKRVFSKPALVAVLSAGFAAAVWIIIEPGHTWSWGHHAFVALVAAGALGALIFYDRAERRCDSREGGSAARSAPTDASIVAEEDRVRTTLSRWLFRGVFVSFLVGAAAFVDDAGRAAYHGSFARDQLDLKTGSFGAFAAAVAFIGRWLLKRLTAVKLPDWPRLSAWIRRFGRIAALVAGLLLLFVLLTFWSAIAYATFWHGQAVAPGESTTWPQLFGSEWTIPVAITLFIGLCALLLGRTHSFLNQSSLASFYSGRLRKAYLGASNHRRTRDHVPPDHELPDDDIALPAYFHEGVLAPVHLINVTINETTSASSRVIQRDRKGKAMAVTPGGYTYSHPTPTSSPIGFPVDKGEQLPLSTWMGISGAAFSTGMGQHTSFGLSLLAGLTNLRLGYWWDSPVRGKGHDFVQSYLLREIRASFEGTHSNRWYLSDGGHFENTGVYELVRRKVPFIIACDNGADPEYEFADFVNLVRKIRIDLDAETELVSPEELDSLMGEKTPLRRTFGTLEEIAANQGDDRKGDAGPYAALARIKYLGSPGTGDSTLLLIKPRITGSELPDLLRYKKMDVAFPQQPTTDLFFDEAQWESYFRLGQLIVETIFSNDHPREQLGDSGSPVRALWRPIDLSPI